jgi:hypothetical protein
VLGCTALTVAAMLWMPVDPAKPLPGRILVFSFLAGVALYLYRDRVRYSLAWLAAAVAASVLMLSIAPLSYLAAIPMARTLWEVLGPGCRGGRWRCAPCWRPRCARPYPGLA